MGIGISVFIWITIIFSIIYFLLFIVEFVANKATLLVSGGIYLGKIDMDRKSVHSLTTPYEYSRLQAYKQLPPIIRNFYNASKGRVSFDMFLSYFDLEFARKIDFVINSVVNNRIEKNITLKQTILCGNYNKVYLTISFWKYWSEENSLLIQIEWQEKNKYKNLMLQNKISSQRIVFDSLGDLLNNKNVLIIVIQKNNYFKDYWEQDYEILNLFIRTTRISKKNIYWMNLSNKIYIFVTNPPNYETYSKGIHDFNKKNDIVGNSSISFEKIGVVTYDSVFAQNNLLNDLLIKTDFALYKSRLEQSGLYFFNEMDEKKLSEFELFKNEFQNLKNKVLKPIQVTEWLEIIEYNSKDIMGYFWKPEINLDCSQEFLENIKKDSYYSWLITSYIENNFLELSEKYDNFLESEIKANPSKNDSIKTRKVFCVVWLTWLFTNYERIRTKNIVYVIKEDLQKYDVDFLKNIVKFLLEQKISICFLITETNSAIKAKINYIKPTYVILGSKIASNLLEYIECEKFAMSISKICDFIGSKLIYENLSNKIDKIRADWFGISATYSN